MEGEVRLTAETAEELWRRVKKQGEGYRAYVLVSCAGTIKK